MTIARFANSEARSGLHDLSNGTAHGGAIIHDKHSRPTWDKRHGAGLILSPDLYEKRLKFVLVLSCFDT